MKKWGEIWSSFPVAHRKRFGQALGLYLLLCGATAVWIGMHGKDTVKDWQSRIPSAQAQIRDVDGVAETPEVAEAETDDVTIPATPTFDKASAVPGFDQDMAGMPDGRIYISLIVSDMGLSSSVTKRALETLPKEVTLAFSPYADDLPDWFKKASELNREKLIFMPMESATYPLEDPGPRAMSSRLSDDENNQNLNWVLNQGKGADGVINFMGSRFLTDKKRLIPVLQSLKKNRSMFIETGSPVKSAVPELANEFGLPYLAVDLKVDAETSEAAIKRQLEKLEQIAKDKGYAVGIAAPYPLTINTIKSWSARLSKQGITLAPLKTLWKHRPHDTRTSPIPEQAPK